MTGGGLRCLDLCIKAADLLLGLFCDLGLLLRAPGVFGLVLLTGGVRGLLEAAVLGRLVLPKTCSGAMARWARTAHPRAVLGS